MRRHKPPELSLLRQLLGQDIVTLRHKIDVSNMVAQLFNVFEDGRLHRYIDLILVNILLLRFSISFLSLFNL